MRYLIAIHRPTGYDPTAESADMRSDIDALNEEMVAAGVRVFVGGLQPPNSAKTITLAPAGNVTTTGGLYLRTSAYVGGFWVIEVANEDGALEWGRKAARACRAAVEVRPFN